MAIKAIGVVIVLRLGLDVVGNHQGLVGYVGDPVSELGRLSQLSI